MYVCICNGVTDRDIRQVAEAGCRTFPELTHAYRLRRQLRQLPGDGRELLDDVACARVARLAGAVVAA